MSQVAAAAAQAIGGLAGSLLDARQSRKTARANIKYQKEFAQHGVSWRVADAKRAGLHPLAALGMQATGFNPVSAPTNFADAGQDIGRAVASGFSREGRDSATGRLAQLGLERAELQNDYLRAQIRNINAVGSPPPRPAPSDPYQVGGSAIPPQVPGTVVVKDKPLERTISDPKISGQEPGSVVDISWSKHPNGRYYLMPSEDAKKRMEDMSIPQWMWAFRNYGHLGHRPGPPFPAPEGSTWLGGPIEGYYLRRNLPQHSRPIWR